MTQSPPPQPEVEIRRSARRKRTVSAHREGERIVVLAPARMSNRELEAYVADLVARIERREGPVASDAELLDRALYLRAHFLQETPAPSGVTWSTRETRQWGSCTPLDRTIRISPRLRRAPQYVIDYVLVHELAHLLHANHSRDFQGLVQRYPDVERAQAFLAGADFIGGTETTL